MTRRVLLVVIASLAACLPVASATTTAGDGVRFRGHTVQHRAVSLRTDAKGAVRAMRLTWVSKCRRGRYTTTTLTRAPFDRATAAVLRDSSRYRERSRSGIVATITSTIAARHRGAGKTERWTGTFSARVVVRRRGKRVDACRTTKPLGWTARLVAPD